MSPHLFLHESPPSAGAHQPEPEKTAADPETVGRDPEMNSWKVNVCFLEKCVRTCPHVAYFNDSFIRTYTARCLYRSV